MSITSRPAPRTADTPTDRVGPAATARRLTGLKPTGHLQLGNLLSAIIPMVRAQDDVPTLAFVADLHALTVTHDPHRLAALTREAAAVVLAAGLDPDRATLFVQSQVPEHALAHYLLEATTTYGEAARMIQFREKAGQQQSVRLSLLTYPTLMAADILLYATAGDVVEVPVGADQDQHLELARTLARRFNRTYGPTFTVPRGVVPAGTGRVMDLAEPGRKMEKTNPSTAGVVFLLDPPDVVRRTVARAVTDSLPGVTYEPHLRPGVANLLAIVGILTGEAPEQVAARQPSCAALKAELSAATLAVLEPLQQRYRHFQADPAELDSVLRRGAERARSVAGPALRLVQERIGLLG